MGIVEEKLQKFREHINVPTVGRRIQIFFLLVILLTIPVTVFIAQNQQDLRQRAQSLPVTPPEPPTPTPIPDSDGDEWGDKTELFIGTDPYDACADRRDDNAWPPDLNNDREVDKDDLDAMKKSLSSRNWRSGDKISTQTSTPKYIARYDLNTDGVLTSADLSLLQQYLGRECTNQTPTSSSTPTPTPSRWQSGGGQGEFAD